MLHIKLCDSSLLKDLHRQIFCSVSVYDTKIFVIVIPLEIWPNLNVNNVFNIKMV